MNPTPCLALLLFLPGEKLPPGPPWHVEYRTARRAALRSGRPIYVYFTKSY